MSTQEKLLNYIIQDAEGIDFSLFSGKSGILITLINYQKSSKSKSSRKIIDIQINKCINSLLDDIENNSMDGSFIAGITGVAYALRFAYYNGFNDLIDIEWFDEIDNVIITYFNHFVSIKELDLLRGLTGIIVYFLKFNIHKDYVDKYVSLLKKTAVWENETCFWYFYSFNKEKVKMEYRKDMINLGMAHGVALIISSLASICKRNIQKKICTQLIIGSTNFLMSQLNSTSLNQFGSVFYKKTNKLGEARLGWCYGDLSTGFSILKAGIICNNKEIYDNGFNICLKTLKKDYYTSHLEEHGFCHGFYGTSYIYYKLFLLTKATKFLEKRDYWISIAEEQRSFNTHELGYFQNDVIGEKTEKHTTSGLLSGLSGILLCLLSFENNTTDFDNLFLLDV